MEQFLALSVILLLIGTSSARESFDEYYKKYDGVIDFSAMKACYVLFGTLAPIDPTNDDKGFTCKYTARVWTASDKDAHEYCGSRNPYHIVKAKSNGATTDCGFQINLQCKPDWYQINNLCYKAFDNKFTYSEAKKHCEKTAPQKAKPQLAEFYSSAMSLYLSDMYFNDAWVTVPHITEYFLNGKDDGAVFLLDGACKYEIKPGSLIMDELAGKHGALCQYTPGINMAEVTYIATVYAEIYPVIVTHNGPIIATASYTNIEQKSVTSNQGKILEKFSTQSMRDRCDAIGNILNVHSFPLISIEAEWMIVKKYLTDHRYYLTSAFKNDGCEFSNYQDHDSNTKMDVAVYTAGNAKQTSVCNAFSLCFSSVDRHPTPAAFRAPLLCTLHSFSFKYGPCPSGWYEYRRNGKTPFCHYIEDKFVPFPDAKRACAAMGASLTGFETKEEYDFIRPFASKGYYYLGGVIPCRTNCDTGYMASWEEGVSRNTSFLNEFADKNFWSNAHTEIVTLCANFPWFHTHPRSFGDLGYICGKYPDLVPAEITNPGVKNQ